MFQGGYKCGVGLQAFIPPTILRGKHRGDKDLVDRRIKLEIRIALSESVGVFCEMFYEPGVLKIIQPVGNTEMAKIYNRCDLQFAQAIERSIRKTPIVFAGAKMREMVRRSITQEFDSNFF